MQNGWRHEVPRASDDQVQADLVADFAQRLRCAHRVAGEPPYRMLERQMAYSRSSIARALHGEVLPRWELVRRLLQAFEVPEEEIHDEWRRRWVQAREQGDPLGVDLDNAVPARAAPANDDAASARPAPAQHERGDVCEECGALVVDSDRHQAWHWNLERQMRRALIRPADQPGWTASGTGSSSA